MIKLKAHNKPFSKQSAIDKFALISKKYSDDFAEGEITLTINGKRTTSRVYEIPCECSGTKHTHKLLDLREVWSKLNLSDAVELEIER